MPAIILGAENRNVNKTVSLPGLSYGLLKKTVMKMKIDLQKLLL